MPQSGQRPRLALRQDGTPVLDTRRVLVVIGNGMVSQRFCERAVELGLPRRYRIIVIGEEAVPAYNRVELTSVLGGRDAASLILKPMLWYAERDIDLRIGERVVTLDRVRRVLVTAFGDEQRYDELVFATGSYASTPVIPGTNQRGVFAYRTLDDARKIGDRARALAREGARAVVIGSGLLGIEAGQAIAALGCAVTFVEAAPHVLPRQLDPVTAGIVSDLLTEAGFELCVGQVVERILLTSEMRRLELARAPSASGVDVPDTRLRVMLRSGRGIDCGMVVLASGVKPRDELARASGLACSPAGGISVDSALMTSDPRVFAIGECARHADRCPGLIAPGYAMAEVLADRLAGKRSTFTGSQASTRLEVSRRPVVVLGEGSPQGADVQALILRTPGSAGYRRLVLCDGRLIGATAIGEGEDLAHLQEAIVMRTPLRGRDLEHLARGLDPWQGQRSTSGSGWPDSATACDCTGVTFGTLRRARADGHRTVEALAVRTGAGSVCGSCRPRLLAFAASNSVVTGSALETDAGAARDFAARSAHLNTRLGLISMAVLVGLCLAMYLGPIAVPVSLRAPRLLEVLWQDHLARQLSGYFLALLSVLTAATIAIDKRRRQRLRVAMPPSRALHAGLGLVCLAGVGVHTTLRLGHGLDRALSLSVLAVIAVGAATALSMSYERRWSGRLGVPLRRLGLRLHLWIAWPAPVLLALHVLKSYYF
jgi:nitrite reductase (NADH) large subunit